MSDPDTTQTEAMLRGITSAVRYHGTLTDTQSSMVSAIGEYLLGVDADPDTLAPLGPGALAEAVSDETLRLRAVHAMVTLEILTDPVPPEVTDQVAQYAKALHVDDGMLQVARDYSAGAMAVAQNDYFRNSYVAEYYGEHANDGTLHRRIRTPDDKSPTDDALEAKWKALETCPTGSHGRTVWDFYQIRGFSLPGSPGAVDPLLAQHDWVRCLADYGTSATGEIEVFSFIASAIPDPKGFSYLVVILGLFQTGYVAQVPGVATADAGHLSKPGGPTRFADAIRRGLAVHRDVMGGVDWFEYADTPLDDVRNKLGVLPKSPDAVAAGSLAALDPKAVFTHDA